MSKVSVIVPVYGVEKYIERCARSLFEQTLNGLEFIFIDDCTPDRSMKILEDVIKEYQIHIKENNWIVRTERMPANSGLPAVRRQGIQLCSGEYVIHCDSDDYVEKEMYEIMYNLASEGNYDLVQCDIDVVDDDGIVCHISSGRENISSNQLREMIINGEISNSLCNKLVKRSLYIDNPIRYPQYAMNEDNTLSCQLAYYSKNLCYIKKSFYKAYQNMKSTSRAPGEGAVNKRYKEAYENSKVDVDFLLSKGYCETSKAVITAKMRARNAIWANVKDRCYYKVWKETYPEINRQLLFNNCISKRTRLRDFILLNIPGAFNL